MIATSDVGPDARIAGADRRVVVYHSTNVTGRDIAVSGTKIARVAANLSAEDARHVLDAKGKLVTPGLIDVHTHVYDGVAPLGLPADIPNAARDWPMLNFLIYHSCIRPGFWMRNALLDVQSGRTRSGLSGPAVPDIIWTTQFFVDGHPGNDRDGIARGGNLIDRELLMVDFKPLKESKIGEWAAHFDIVLGRTPDER